MRKMLFLAAGFAALLMTACGGEKKEEKKEEAKAVSDETKAKFEALKTEWSTVDGMVTSIGDALNAHDEAKMSTYLDSMKGVAEKSKKEIKEQALPLIDSLTALNGMVAELKTTYEGEKETWGMITEEFTKVNTEIEKGDGDDEKIAPRAEGFTIQFNAKKEALAGILIKWNAIQNNDAALKALFAPAVK